MVFVKLEFGGEEFPIHERLKQKLDNIKLIQRKGWDAIFLIDGIEGSGKSTLAITCAWYLTNGKFPIYNLCSNSEDAIDRLKKLPDGSCMIIDEGSLMFASTEVMRREQRTLIKILNVIRQKRMCLIIVSPSFFNLNKYISIQRSRFLLHVYTPRTLKRGSFTYFGEKKKKMLYIIGKKNFSSYSKPRASWNGNFKEFNPFGDAYLTIKKKSLFSAFDKKKELSLTEKQKVIKSYAGDLMDSLPINTREALAKCLKTTPRTLYNWKNGVYGVEDADKK